MFILHRLLPHHLNPIDVDCDGDIDMDDILKIKAHYTFANQHGISGNVDGTIDQTQSIHILAPDTTGA